MSIKAGELIEVQSLEDWWNWLEANHALETTAWLVYYKKSSGIEGVSYGESVEAGLCFGWVDCQVRTLDNERFARKFVPRKPDSQWSESNIRRVCALLASKKIQPAGRALIEAAQDRGVKFSVDG